jgi:hypothetical protein
MASIATATRQRVLEHQERTGDPADKIALVLHLSPSTVARILREAGRGQEHRGAASARQLRAGQAPPVRQLAADGVSPTQICKRLRLGYNTLKLIAAEHDIELPAGRTGAPSAYDQKIGRIRELAAAGLSQSEISHRTSVPMPTLTRWLARAGLVIERDPGRTRDPDHAANFGSTPEERTAAATRGGQSGVGDKEIICLYCQQPFARGRTGSGRSSRDRFCSPEHAYAHRRETSGKTIEAECACGCGEKFLTWASRPKKYISREHWLKANKGVPQYGFEGHVVQGGHEAAFIGLCSLRGVPFEFFDRSQVVRWNGSEFNVYGPDFVLQHRGPLYVDVKGWQQEPRKWAAFREQRGPLAILRKEDLDELFLLPTAAGVLAAIKSKAIGQEA